MPEADTGRLLSVSGGLSAARPYQELLGLPPWSVPDAGVAFSRARLAREVLAAFVQRRPESQSQHSEASEGYNPIRAWHFIQK